MSEKNIYLPEKKSSTHSQFIKIRYIIVNNNNNNTTFNYLFLTIALKAIIYFVLVYIIPYADIFNIQYTK